MARKSKYTPDVVDKIVQAIRLGSTYALASQYAGITYETFNEWMKNKPEFSFAIKEAEGKAAATWLARIEDAAKSQWQAAAWKLERRYPQDYGRTVQDHNVDMKVSGDVTLYLPKKGDK